MPSGRGKRLGERSMLSRASEQAGDGASMLFDRLDANHTRRQGAAETLSRLAELVRARRRWSASWRDRAHSSGLVCQSSRAPATGSQGGSGVRSASASPLTYGS